MASPTGRAIRAELLDRAEHRIRRHGANGFSFADLADDVGVRAPSVHHHFRTKDDLVAEVTERYRERFAAELDQITGTPPERFAAYCSLFARAADEDLMCLCAAMVADWDGAGRCSQVVVAAFFDDQSQWLRACLRDGVASGAFRADLDVDATAAIVLAAMEGSLILRRAGDTSARPGELSSALLRLLA